MPACPTSTPTAVSGPPTGSGLATAAHHPARGPAPHEAAMHIIDLTPEAEEVVQQIAELLVAAFAPHYPGSWDTTADALAEVHESFGDGRISRVALDDDGRVLGWIGGIRTYDGHAWELHPLA